MVKAGDSIPDVKVHAGSSVPTYSSLPTARAAPSREGCVTSRSPTVAQRRAEDRETVVSTPGRNETLSVREAASTRRRETATTRRTASSSTRPSSSTCARPAPARRCSSWACPAPSRPADPSSRSPATFVTCVEIKFQAHDAIDAISLVAFRTGREERRTEGQGDREGVCVLRERRGGHARLGEGPEH